MSQLRLNGSARNELNQWRTTHASVISLQLEADYLSECFNTVRIDLSSRYEEVRSLGKKLYDSVDDLDKLIARHCIFIQTLKDVSTECNGQILSLEEAENSLITSNASRRRSRSATDVSSCQFMDMKAIHAVSSTDLTEDTDTEGYQRVDFRRDAGTSGTVVNVEPRPSLPQVVDCVEGSNDSEEEEEIDEVKWPSKRRHCLLNTISAYPVAFRTGGSEITKRKAVEDMHDAFNNKAFGRDAFDLHLIEGDISKEVENLKRLARRFGERKHGGVSMGGRMRQFKDVALSEKAYSVFLAVCGPGFFRKTM